MKKLFIIAPALCFLANASVYSQGAVSFSTRYDEKNCAIIKADLNAAGNHTVFIEFYDVENTLIPRLHTVSFASSRDIMKLRPTDTEQPLRYRFKSRGVRGLVNPKNVDTAFVYRLPFSASEEKKAGTLSDFYEKHMGRSRSIDMKAFQFIMNPADTVYAMRKGVVMWVDDGYDPLTGMGRVALRTEINQIFVEHSDGTMARYGVLHKGSIMVRPGDTVYPDTPLALAGSMDDEVYQLRISIFYNVVDNIEKNNTLDDIEVMFAYVDPVFATCEGQVKLARGSNCKPIVTHEMVVREMTGRELKRLKQR